MGEIVTDLWADALPYRYSSLIVEIDLNVSLLTFPFFLAIFILTGQTTYQLVKEGYE